MTTLSSRYGSVLNVLTDAAVADREVVPGAPATLLLWSDRVPYVITRVAPFASGPRKGQPRKVWARRVEVEADKSKTLGVGHQNWLIHLDQPIGPEVEFTARSNGDLRPKGGTSRLVVGRADYYYDWSF